VLINGVASSLRVLRALGALLADVNGQHASLALRDSATQLQLLDSIAGTGSAVQHQQ
jgi:DNA repair ATPase RecN